MNEEILVNRKTFSGVITFAIVFFMTTIALVGYICGVLIPTNKTLTKENEHLYDSIIYLTPQHEDDDSLMVKRWNIERMSGYYDEGQDNR